MEQVGPCRVNGQKRYIPCIAGLCGFYDLAGRSESRDHDRQSCPAAERTRQLWRRPVEFAAIQNGHGCRIGGVQRNANGAARRKFSHRLGLIDQGSCLSEPLTKVVGGAGEQSDIDADSGEPRTERDASVRKLRATR
jgi:hypothetical protein